jgi:hypothetical protein
MFEKTVDDEVDVLDNKWLLVLLEEAEYNDGVNMFYIYAQFSSKSTKFYSIFSMEEIKILIFLSNKENKFKK